MSETEPSLQPGGELPDDVFPPDVCPVCGYSLQGLPGEGICPECGKKYDSSELILYGWARGRHATAANSRGLSFVVSLLPVVFFWQFYAFGSWRFRAILIGCWLLSVVPALLKRKATDHPGAIQLRLDRYGIRQIDDLSVLAKTDNILVGRGVGWHNVQIDIWKSRSPEKLRIRCKLRYPWYRPVGEPYPIDAEVRCTPSDAAKLRARIDRWKSVERSDVNFDN